MRTVWLAVLVLLQVTLSLRVVRSNGEYQNRDLFQGEMVCDVGQYGAKGDGHTVDTVAIQKAINACAAAGGGIVYLSLGTVSSRTYVSGALWLKTNITFYLGSYVTLLGAVDKTNATWPYTYLRYGGLMSMKPASLLNAGECLEIDYNPRLKGDQCKQWSKLENVIIAGGGGSVIDGNGASGWYNPPYQNIRPVLLNLMWVSGLTVTTLTLTNPPFWTLHPTFCNFVTITAMNITTSGPNTDGIDPDSCTNVEIATSYISSGDDCIAIKSGLNEEGRLMAMPSANISVIAMDFGLGHGVSIGSEMSGGVNNVTMEAMGLMGTNTGVRIKSELGRGGYVTNILYRKIQMQNVPVPISITQFYQPHAIGVPPRFENITVEDMIADTAQQAGQILCVKEMPCRNIKILVTNITHVKNGFQCENAYGIASDVTPPLTCLLH